MKQMSQNTVSPLHPRNKHCGRYDFKQLTESYPALFPFVQQNIYGDLSINFFDPQAVKMLNKALLKHFYQICRWDIPANYLCPPIPGRADYIHYIADLLATCNNNVIPKGHSITCLDIGVGANCIYPIIGYKEYGWSFIGCDIDSKAISSAKKNILDNADLKNSITIRLQSNKNVFFQNILQKHERIDVSICNPPFHSSLIEAQAGARRKLNNLTRQNDAKLVLNFGGQANELYCEGGERQFIQDMIFQSKDFSQSCLWFSSLVAKEIHLKSIYQALKNISVRDVKTIPMNQGNKKSRIVAWSFLTKEQQRDWAKSRW